ncbi:DUF2057 domain-containing protein [Vibrio sp. JPW-9-11-11]|uniref:YccT family protein n=1 Tax=Vibrio sp. JPW-9-11-11 TaxID=1416532 RepID=UPI00159488B3|nr:DUF2057 family protein [Vibrio sp. JPW-9-11-11]NVD06360.1 DUF2057 domain-containing protein [Vibrio sp. JPW-9-11-11]
MKYCLIITMLSSLVIGSVSAATLTPKRGVDILYINGQASQSKIGENQIEQGFNQVVLRMNKDMSKGSSSDVFTSKPFAISFDVRGDEVVIDHPIARSMNEAKKAFKNNTPEWFVEVDGNLVDYQQSHIKGKSGFLPFSGLQKRVAEHNAKQGIYFSNGKLVDKPADPLTVQQAVSVASVTSAASSPSKVLETNTKKVSTRVEEQAPQNLDQLKAWYLKSSKEERKAFRRWMIDQE